MWTKEKVKYIVITYYEANRILDELFLWDNIQE